MFRKSILIAIAAAGTFGLTALSSTTASALPGYHGPAKVAAARVAGPRIGVRVTPRHPGIVVHPRFPGRPFWHVHYRYPRLWYVPRPVVYGAVAPLLAPTSRCTCLTKEYTPDGAVLFKDICTNEAAINPPAVAPTAQVQPQQ